MITGLDLSDLNYFVNSIKMKVLKYWNLMLSDNLNNNKLYTFFQTTLYIHSLKHNRPQTWLLVQYYDQHKLQHSHQ